MTAMIISEPIRLEPEQITVMDPVVINSINVFSSWSYNTPIVGNQLLLPAIVVDSLDNIPSDLPAGTAILVRATD